MPALLACSLGVTAEPAAPTSAALAPKVASPAIPAASATAPGFAVPASSDTGETPVVPGDVGNAVGPIEPLPEVQIEAPGPRYVAPTLRDSIGRIWAPVLVDGKGPFRLVLDTGASHSAVTAPVAYALGISLGATHVRLRGVMGIVEVPTIHVANLIIGDMQINSTSLPIVPDALGGADGVLGTEGLLDKRIFIDFRHDLITITKSRGRRADYGYVTVPVSVLLPAHLLATTAYIGTIKVTAIIDTGAQTSIANLALRKALLERRKHYRFTADQIVDTTDTVGEGQGANVAPIRLGAITISSAHLTIGDVGIFEAWNLADTPAVLIGMDALGTVDVLVIDYRRSELQILPRGSSNWGHSDRPSGNFRERGPLL